MKTAVIGMFWRTRAYFGGHQPALTGNGVESTISRHCPPIPASLGTQAKIEERIWQPSSATLVAVKGGPEYNEY